MDPASIACVVTTFPSAVSSAAKVKQAPELGV